MQRAVQVLKFAAWVAHWSDTGGPRKPLVLSLSNAVDENQLVLRVRLEYGTPLNSLVLPVIPGQISSSMSGEGKQAIVFQYAPHPRREMTLCHQESW